MGTHPRFPSDPLRTMVGVGRIGPSSVRLWLRDERPGRVRVAWWPADDPPNEAALELDIPDDGRDHTAGVDVPGDGQPLRPLTVYRYRITRQDDRRVVGEGRFRTAPASVEDTPRRFSIAFGSCHLPFDADGAVRPDAVSMLSAIPRCLEQHDARLVFLMGDQIYSDMPGDLSLFDEKHLQAVGPPGRRSIFDCSDDEVRALYHMRYRIFWNQPGWQRMHAEWPCHLILDDHDLIDCWGSHTAHRGEPWLTIQRGGRAACFDYQMRRVMAPDGAPPSFHYDVEYGHTAVFVTDIRSQRRVGEGSRLYGDQQEADLTAFLQRNGDKKIIALVMSVPMFHLPRWATKLSTLPWMGENFADRWGNEAHMRDRDRVLELLVEHQRAHPDQLVVMFGGDIHVGGIQRIAWEDGTPPLYQAISSPLTHRTNPIMKTAASMTLRMKRNVKAFDDVLEGDVTLLPADEGAPSCNPCGEVNLGIMDVETPAGGGPPTVRFHLYSHDGAGQPRRVYGSPPLRAGGSAATASTQPRRDERSPA